jgi:hypothetical protein
MEGDMTRTTVYISASVIDRARENGIKKGMLSDFVTVCLKAVGDGDPLYKVSPEPLIGAIERWRKEQAVKKR